MGPLSAPLPQVPSLSVYEAHTLSLHVRLSHYLNISTRHLLSCLDSTARPAVH